MAYSESQTILNVMFEILSRCHAGELSKDREQVMGYARDQLREMGIDVEPQGLLHAVLRGEDARSQHPKWPKYFPMKTLLGSTPDVNRRKVYWREEEDKPVLVMNEEMRPWTVRDQKRLEIILKALNEND